MVYDEILAELRAIRKLLEKRLSPAPRVLANDPRVPVREIPHKGKIK